MLEAAPVLVLQRRVFRNSSPAPFLGIKGLIDYGALKMRDTGALRHKLA